MNAAIKLSPRIRRITALIAVSLSAWLLAALPQRMLPLQGMWMRGDDFFYDSFYHLRPAADRTQSSVLIVAVDQASLTAVDKTYKYGWPWPREFFGDIATYLDRAGAKAIVFDTIFSETSAYQDATGDDDTFASAVKALKTPVVFGSEVSPDSTFVHFAPAIPHPILAAVNVGHDKIYRVYDPTVYGRPSLAVAAVQAAGAKPQLATGPPFRLHYYGPHVQADGQDTFLFIPAAKVLGAQLQGPAAAKAAGITPDLFTGKIVLIGGTAAGTFDVKSSPLSTEYPGVEVQATAIENLLDGASVQSVSPFWLWACPLCFAGFTAAGVIYPKRASLKMLVPALGVAVLFYVVITLFRGDPIRFMSPVVSLLAIAIATLAAFAFTYFAQDRQRRFMLKALSKVVSPKVAAQLAESPERLALGTVRTDLTVLFTDLANFTDLSEAMDVQALGAMLNRYLGEMSNLVLGQDGTLDKYIGDAIMCFWNAPLPQADHAARACRAALAIAACENRIQQDLANLGATRRIFTRIGINTTSAAVGFIGSDHLFNYTALGDGVNLASRLEGANKLYGTQILLSDNTARLVAPYFILRKIDVIRVKGKRQPMPVFELLAERGNSGSEQRENLAKAYESAFALYQQRDWAKAEEKFLDICQTVGDDSASRAFIKRIHTYRTIPPAADWDGVYDSKEK